MRSKIIGILFLLFPAFISAGKLSISSLTGSYFTGKYPNLFVELLNKSQSQVNSKIESAVKQLFFGNDSTQRLYYPVGSNMAYIEDINNNDVRTEGMSYGLMITVQLNMKNEFDRLWKWAKTYMQIPTGQHKNYFAWHCKTDGTIIDSNSASDGEQWFVMSLFFASARWGDGQGIYNYKAEAQKILNAMLDKKESSDRNDIVTNMFNKKEKEVVFVPMGNVDDFTDPSYHLPHYYELWARWADTNNNFWCSAASISRKFLTKAANPVTGLTPDYADFNGTPFTSWRGGKNNFLYDAWRVAMNVSVDYEWFAKDKWEVTECNKLLNFFYSKGIGKYGNLFTLNGKQLSNEHSAGLVAMNAVACLASTNENRKAFIEELWNTSIPTGHYRYYDGMLYMLAMLQVSGHFKIYSPAGIPVGNCSNN
ncbi:MAG: glycosyl hydrolase family 8 [Ignavibacteriaceae bacterium]